MEGTIQDQNRHLYRLKLIIPYIDQVRHGVAIGLYHQGAQLAVHGKQGQVHWTGTLTAVVDISKQFSTYLDGQSHAPQYLSQVSYPQELVVLRSCVEVSNLLIHKESVRNPDLLYVVSTNYKLLNTILRQKVVNHAIFGLQKYAC